VILESDTESSGQAGLGVFLFHGTQRVQHGHIDVVILAIGLDRGFLNVRNFLIAPRSKEGTKEQVVLQRKPALSGSRALLPMNWAQAAYG
jgi:hypothetical protein